MCVDSVENVFPACEQDHISSETRTTGRGSEFDSALQKLAATRQQETLYRGLNCKPCSPL